MLARERMIEAMAGKLAAHESKAVNADPGVDYKDLMRPLAVELLDAADAAVEAAGWKNVQIQITGKGEKVNEERDS
jgi:hypothetical protein